jgi:hypothetical protein
MAANRWSGINHWLLEGMLARFNEATKEMKKKPDLLLVLMLVLGLGVLASTYTQGEPDPEMVASQFSIR